MVGTALGELNVTGIELHDRQMSDQVGLSRHGLSIHLEALLTVLGDGGLQSKRLSPTGLSFDPEVEMISPEGDEFAVAVAAVGTPQRQVAQPLQEVGLPLTIPSQEDIDLGRNVQRNFP